MEVNKNDLVYNSLFYKLSDPESPDNLISFYVNPAQSENRIDCELNSFSYYALEEIILKNNKEMSDFNIINMYNLIFGSNLKINTMFLCYDINNKPVIRTTIVNDFTKEENKCVLIIDLDVMTGVSLAYLLKVNISMLQREFQKFRIKKQ